MHQKPFIVLTSGWAGAGLDITPQHNSGHSSGRTVFRIFYEIILIESAAVASRRSGLGGEVLLNKYWAQVLLVLVLVLGLTKDAELIL